MNKNRLAEASSPARTNSRPPVSTIFWLAALLAAALSFTFYRVLARDAFLRGTDAYYYALQGKYWAKTGAVIIPDPSPIHRITGTLMRLGLAPGQAIKTWTAFALGLGALLFATAFLRKKNTHTAPVFIFIWLLASPSMIFTAIEFPKMFSMLIVLPLWFAPLIGNSEGSRWPWAVLISLLSTLLHRAALPLAVLFSASLLAGRAMKEWRLGPKKRYAALCLALFGLVAFFFLKRHFDFLDFSRISWTDRRTGVGALLLRRNLPFSLKTEIVFSLVVLIATSMWTFRSLSRKADLLAASALLGPALLPLGVKEVFDVGERYALLIPTISMSACVFLLSLRQKTQTPSFASKNRTLLLGWAAGCLLFIFTAEKRLRDAHPLRLDPDFRAYEQVSAELGQEKIPMLIAHKGLAYYYKYRWMREAFPYEPENHWNKQRVWRLLYKIFPEELNYYLGRSCLWDSGLVKATSNPDYFLIREDCWAEMRGRIREEENVDLYDRAWKSPLNPATRRPKFLYRKHRSDSNEEGEFPALPRRL